MEMGVVEERVRGGGCWSGVEVSLGGSSGG